VLLETSADNTGQLIVGQAKDWPADIIVMGTHGRRGLGRVVLGSEAEYVVRHTPVPVLLIRKQ
jgi:nucleotide-binding universal stress UspA family protein